MENLSNIDILYRISAPLSDVEMNSLHSACWHDHRQMQFGAVLDRSLAYVTAYCQDRLIGFVNLAWDGGEHAFLLDTLVHPDFRHRGVGTELVKRGVSEARNRDLTWIHVDFEPHLRGFYTDCGFRPTEAGLVRLKAE